MSLYDGYTERKNEENRNKMKKLILIAIIVICLLIFALIGLIIFISNQPKSLSLTLDGKKNDKLLQLLDIKVDEAGNMEIYAPIKELAGYFGYDYNNGNHMVTSEDNNSGYVENEQEVAIFSLDSNIVLKKDLTNEKSNYEEYQISKKTYKQNDQLYTNDEGLELAFNINIFYDVETNTLDVYTLDYYITFYTTPNSETQKTLIQDLQYSELDETFVNQKALLDDMLVVKNDAGVYSVITPNGEKLLSTQYKSLTYIPENKSFLIQGSDLKYGISSIEEGNVVPKIKPVYTSLKLIDSEKQLYLVSDNNKFGVIDINSNIIVPLDFANIGIKVDDFAANNLTNGYILQNKLIPVQQDGKWGFYDLSGKLIGEGIVYDKIGCITKNSQGTTAPVLSIPEYSLIVVSKNERYGCINLEGETKIPLVADDFYMQVLSGEKKYIMSRTKDEQVQTRDISELIK